MTNILPLNNVVHKDLKIVQKYSEDFGHNVGAVLTFPTEFADIQREYPILFQKNAETQKFQSIALLGLTPNENLFLKDDKWNARYIPAIVAREPFVIGFEDQSATGGEKNAPVVMVDMDSPRISTQEGQPVFLEFGGNTRYLERVNSILQSIYQGSAISDEMFEAFTELDLIEPVSLEVKLNNGEVHRLTGNYTIHREKLNSLSAENLEKLNKAGFLEGAFLITNSLNNMQNLIDIKNSGL
ncbi:SapC family protein [Cellvibrio sp.]|uniref:SapC family protein n=1 Tax=Cellvibrio sp. TaxID=1965322 RepID=UPI0039647A19